MYIYRYLIIRSPWGFSILQHCFGDFARMLMMQFTSTEGMSNDTPYVCEIEIDRYTGDYVPYSLRRVCGFFNVPHNLLHVQVF